MSDGAATNFQEGRPTSGVAAATMYEDAPFFDAGLYDGFDHEEACLEDKDCRLESDDEDEGPLSNIARSTLHHVAQMLFFAGSQLSSLTAILLLLNLCKTHQCSNLFNTKLLTILGMSILPEINTLSRLEYLASKILRQLGLEYESIHMCLNNCLLYRDDVNGTLIACSVSEAPRYKQVGDTWIPMKILRHFPLIPRLRRLFSTPSVAALQTWWASHRSPDGNVQGAIDSKQWSAADEIDPEFMREHRNICLGLATDGINPFSIKRSTWSTWPVVLMNYNIPPWLTTKNNFMMLSLIVPRPKSLIGAHFDIILAPLLTELFQLWHKGIVTVDATVYQGMKEFTLRVLLLWTIYDFPAYGLIAGCVTKGFRGCPVCGPSTKSKRSAALKKNLYDDQHRM
jgi:hypothetical protein